MPWVKRNIYFLIGGAIAVALLGLAGFYFYSKWTLNNESQEKLNAAYAELTRIGNLNPNPGNDKISNTENARKIQAQLRSILDRERKFFTPVQPIPAPTGKSVAKEEFASGLRRTIDELERAAGGASVTLPPKYNFSFEAQRSLTTFSAGSLDPLSAQLGDIKSICNVLFRARVNALDNLRRTRVSDDDSKGSQSDYLDPTVMPETNALAVLTPYEVTFRCFSAELGGVLAGFANDPHGFIVKTINVESEGAAANAAAIAADPAAMQPAAAAYQSRRRGGAYVAPVVAPVAAPASKGPSVMLDEKQLRVTMIVELVKLLQK